MTRAGGGLLCHPVCKKATMTGLILLSYTMLTNFDKQMFSVNIY